MPGKPGRPITAKSLKEYFATGTAKKLWSEGKRKADEGGYGGGVFDDGRYRVALTDAYSSVSQKGRPQNVFGFKFLEGDYKGQKVFKYQGVDNETGVAILLRDFKLLEQEIEDPEEIDGANKKILKSGAVLTIRLKTNGEYQNVILERLLEADENEKEEENEDDDSDDESAKEDQDADEEADESDETDDDAESDDEDEDEETEEEEEDSDSDDEDEDEEDDDEKETKPKGKAGKTGKSRAVKEEEVEEISLEVGMKVKLKDGSKGKIVKILEDEGQIKIKLPNGDKKKVSVEDIADLA